MRRATSTTLLVSGSMIAGCALLAACTGATDEATPETTLQGEGGSAGQAGVIAFENPDADDFNLLLESSDDLIGGNPVAILNVEGTGGTELILSFEMGSHYCFGVQANAQESETDVVLEIKTGLLPGVDPASCRYGVYPYTTSVTLAEPLGDRTIATAEEREPTAVDETAAGQATDPAAQGTPPAEADPEPETGAETGSETANPPSGGGGAMPVPLEQGGTTLTIDDASQLIGRHVEDGVEWAIANDVEWRVLSYDGEQVAEDSPLDTTRISFVVDSDLIVRFEWS